MLLVPINLHRKTKAKSGNKLVSSSDDIDSACGNKSVLYANFGERRLAAPSRPLHPVYVCSELGSVFINIYVLICIYLNFKEHFTLSSPSSDLSSMSYDYSRTFNIPILKELLGALSLPEDGKKSELAARLREHDEQSDCPAYKLWDYYTITGEIPVTRTEQTRAEKFSKLDSPSAEAKFDPRWFISKYFLNSAGEPERRTTPTPIELYGLYALQRQRVHAAAGGIPGLYTASSGPDSSRVLSIGWDKSSIVPRVNCARELLYGDPHSAATEPREKKRQRYLAHVQTRNTNNPKQEFKPRLAIGSYIIECETISDQYSSRALKLDIMHGSEGLAGGFDLGVVKGIMRFGPRPRAFHTSAKMPKLRMVIMPRKATPKTATRRSSDFKKSPRTKTSSAKHPLTILQPRRPKRQNQHPCLRIDYTCNGAAGRMGQT